MSRGGRIGLSASVGRPARAVENDLRYPPKVALNHDSVLFRADGTFEAIFDGCDLKPHYDSVARPSGNHLTGKWRAGDLCADRLFFPGVVVETEPEVPNTLLIVKLGDRLAIVGGYSGLFDASYYREQPE